MVIYIDNIPPMPTFYLCFQDEMKKDILEKLAKTMESKTLCQI